MKLQIIAGLCAAIIAGALAPPGARARDNEQTAAANGSAAIPDLLGPWNNANGFRLDPAPSGPKPVGDLAGYVHHERGVDAKGNDFSTNAYIGDYNSPILTPWASAILKKEAEEAIKGNDPFWAATACYPFGPTVILQPEPVIFIQQPDKVTIVYQRDHQVRHIYLNVPHSRAPKPSWYGESVGHYEGDTLVVDTIGFNLNDKTFVDRWGTPHSDELHMVERYKPGADGRTMIAEVSYDDPKAYTSKWTAIIRYRKGGGVPVEVACAESPVDPTTGMPNPIPVAAKPDF